MENLISFTALAKEKVKDFMNQMDKPNLCLRIEVKEKTQTGFSYRFTLEETQEARTQDTLITQEGFTTRLDPFSAKWLKGSTIDWITDQSSPGFSVKNPNNPNPTVTKDALEQDIIEAIKTIFDPEIPVNIYELGLIYNIDINPTKHALITMTLTAPNCPAAEQLPAEVKQKVKNVPGVTEAEVKITWEPPWDKNMMSEAAKLQLGI